MSEEETDPWRAGGVSEKRARRWLGDLSETTFKRLARQEQWPRKRIRGTTRVVYPRAVVREFLKACEEA